jgi:hypothetical protein
MIFKVAKAMHTIIMNLCLFLIFLLEELSLYISRGISSGNAPKDLSLYGNDFFEEVKGAYLTLIEGDGNFPTDLDDSDFGGE